MNANMRRILTTVLAFAVVAVGTAVAQDVTEREKQQQQERVQAAERRLQEAQHALQEALQMLQDEQSTEARQRMQEASNELRRAISELDRNRYYTRAYELFSDAAGPLGGIAIIGGSGAKMGVYLSTARNSETDSIGAVLDRVVEDGPASQAGLEDGDIITMANGSPLARTSRRDTSPSNKLTGIKDEMEIGDTLHVEYRRGSETRSADIVLDELESDLSWTYSFSSPEVLVSPRGMTGVRAAPRISVRTPSGVSTMFSGSFWPMGWFEMELVELDEDLGAYFGTSEGLLVIRAPEHEDLDFRSGDVILDVDGRRPADQSHLVRIMRSYEAGETMNIGIMRNRTRETVSVQVPERDSDFSWYRRQ